MGETLRTTPLTDWHAAHGARMVPFAGFSMPVQYAAGIQTEVRLVRTEAGLFDLCHMGRMVLTGPDRVRAADHLLSQNVARIPEGAIRYSLICARDGTVVDDVLVYRAADRVHVVINASGREVDDVWFREHASGFDVTIDNVSDRQTMLALQGPLSKPLLARICDTDLDGLRYYHFMNGRLLGSIETLISRTGYSGEDGFELFFPLDKAVPVWEALVEAGGQPIGLGARDVCRTEAGMPLYGHEINREITPLEARLEFGMDLEQDFIGCAALRAQRESGVPRSLVGLKVEGRRFPATDAAFAMAARTWATSPAGPSAPPSIAPSPWLWSAATWPATGSPSKSTCADGVSPPPWRVCRSTAGSARRRRLEDKHAMSRPDNARYTPTHEWVTLEGDSLTLGISDFAVEHLGDIVFVDLPDVGTEVEKGRTILEIESVKAVAEVYSPVDGTITAVNETLADDPSSLAADCFGGGWLVKIEVKDAAALDALMDLAAYEKHLETAEPG